MWGTPSVFLEGQLEGLRSQFVELSRGIPLHDYRAELGDLVGPFDNYWAPVHRWYPYKEAFSHNFPEWIREKLGVKAQGTAIDVFAGVATTSLALRRAGFDSVVGVEYSPFSHLVGEVKLSWPKLHPRRIERAIESLLTYEVSDRWQAPTLSSFKNSSIFKRATLNSLLSARAQIGKLDVWPSERDFLLVGLAAIVEDVSGAMKDGRALRILNGRSRTSRMLVAHDAPAPSGDPVRDALAIQLTGMKEDLEDLADVRSLTRATTAHHLRGDARNLAEVRLSPRRPALGAGSAALSIFSPPYLNCIDYSEIYKLELWILELVQSGEQFRELRLGTLRSHPSVDFPDQGYLNGVDTPFATLVAELSEFIERQHAQAAIGRMVRNYFDDMYRVLSQQAWVIEPGGWMVCVVGNSTFSRRIIESGERKELWRIPVLTDVVLARMAKSLGFEEVQIWAARDLRARNVTNGRARESAIIARKPA